MFTDGKPIRLDWDERREVYRLIDRLDKRDRIGFLKWACARVSKPGATTFVEKTSGETQEVFWDALTLAFSYGLSLTEMGEYLIRMVGNRHRQTRG
jgi:hypothetical protein